MNTDKGSSQIREISEIRGELFLADLITWKVPPICYSILLYEEP